MCSVTIPSILKSSVRYPVCVPLNVFIVFIHRSNTSKYPGIGGNIFVMKKCIGEGTGALCRSVLVLGN